MKTVTWKTRNEHALQGEIEVVLPKYTERLRLMKDCNFKVDEKGEIVTGFEQIESLIVAIEKSKPFIKSVNLLTKDGQKVESFDELEVTAGCDAILTELAFFVINGPQLGNN